MITILKPLCNKGKYFFRIIILDLNRRDPQSFIFYKWQCYNP